MYVTFVHHSFYGNVYTVCILWHKPHAEKRSYNVHVHDITLHQSAWTLRVPLVQYLVHTLGIK